MFKFKWDDFDKDTNVGEKLRSMEAVESEGHTGSWTILNNCTWKNFVALARYCDYIYRFEFSEDWQPAFIVIKAKLYCIPCGRS